MIYGKGRVVILNRLGMSLLIIQLNSLISLRKQSFFYRAACMARVGGKGGDWASLSKKIVAIRKGDGAAAYIMRQRRW